MVVKERKALPRLTNKFASRSMIASVGGARNVDMERCLNASKKSMECAARKCRGMGEGYIIMRGPQP